MLLCFPKGLSQFRIPTETYEESTFEGTFSSNTASECGGGGGAEASAQKIKTYHCISVSHLLLYQRKTTTTMHFPIGFYFLFSKCFLKLFTHSTTYMLVFLKILEYLKM